MTLDAIRSGQKRIVVTSPTGSGKTIMMIDLIEHFSDMGRVMIYTNRRLLHSQLVDVLGSHGIEVGMIAAGMPRNDSAPVQVVMVQTQISRIAKRIDKQVDKASLVIVDERHIQNGDCILSILENHVAHGTPVVGYTATPLDLINVDCLLQPAKMSDCFRCGAIVPAMSYSPDVPNLKFIRKYRVGFDFTSQENRSAIMRPGIFGRVIKHATAFNPEMKHIMLFGPDVGGSLYFAEKFWAEGYGAAHIDGQRVWFHGEWMDGPSDENRQIAIDSWRKGRTSVLCSRFVLREGIDLPETKHIILATCFGAMTSFLQTCGRGMRAFDGKSHVILQDHGGNVERFLSPNIDRNWMLNGTNAMVVGIIASMIRHRKMPEPITCPKCFGMRLGGDVCPKCGYHAIRPGRMVVEYDGTLRLSRASIYPRRVERETPSTLKVWKRCYYGHRRKKRTFNQAYAWFYRIEGYWPPRNLPLMPKLESDWSRRIADVPVERLYAEQQESSSVAPTT